MLNMPGLAEVGAADDVEAILKNPYLIKNENGTSETMRAVIIGGMHDGWKHLDCEQHEHLQLLLIAVADLKNIWIGSDLRCLAACSWSAHFRGCRYKLEVIDCVCGVRVEIKLLWLRCREKCLRHL